MNSENDPFVRPDWVPAQGHAIRLAGVHFDAVRVRGCPGEEVLSTLLAERGGAAGPVIHGAQSNEVTFLVRAGTTDAYAWPVSWNFAVMSASLSRRDYIGVPALTGATWPLLWRSMPTAREPFVSTAALHDAVGRCLGPSRAVPMGWT
jgi:hypothetical protein